MKKKNLSKKVVLSLLAMSCVYLGDPAMPARAFAGGGGTDSDPRD